jgi:Gp59 loader of gp41 DNA helicase
MTGYDVCKMWCSAKAHYNSDYNILKYNWSFNLSEEAFRSRRDRFTFERLAREYEDEPIFKQAVGFYLYDNPKGIARNLTRPNPIVESALSRFSNLYENFRLDYVIFMNKPPILAGVVDGSISPEGACIMLDYFNIGFDIPDPWRKIRSTSLLPKYNAFIGYNKSTISEIIKSYK